MHQVGADLQRIRLSNGRVVRLRAVPEGLRCPVCGNVEAVGSDWWRRPEPIQIEAESDAYFCDDFDICGCCGREYGFDASLGPELEVFRQNQGARAEWLRTVGRAPEVFQQVLWNLGIVPDHEGTGAEGSADGPVLLAVIRDNLAALPKAVDPPALEARDHEGWTILHWAVALGRVGATDHLLALGADAQAKTARGETPLMWAAWMGDLPAVDALVARGAEIDAPVAGGRPGQPPKPSRSAPPDRTGQTALMWAAEQGHADVVARLLSLGASVDARDSAGRTALMAAASPAIVQSLVRAGADLHARDRWGHTALLSAARAGRDEVLAPLVEAGANPDDRLPARDGECALELAIGRNDHGTVEALIGLGADVNARAPNGGTPLQEAACLSDPRMVRILLNADAEVNARGYRMGTPLLSALFRMGPKVDNVAALLDAGADPNIPNQRGETPLMIASMHRRPPLIELLLRHGARVNDHDRKRETALHRAVKSGAVEIVQMLLGAGADATLRDWKGLTPPDYARLRGAAAVASLFAAREKD